MVRGIWGIVAAGVVATMTCQLEALDNAYFNSLRSERVVSEKKIAWEQVGPGNAGFSNIMRYHPTQPDTIYMCPDMWNSYQSDDNGTSWYNIKDPDGNGDFYHIRDLYYSPSSPNLGLAIESSQMWKTDDMGKNWSMILNCPWYVKDTDGSDKQGWYSKVSALAIDPSDEKVWYVGEGRHLRGQEWLSCLRDTTAANPHGYDNDWKGKIWKTTDAGTNWSELTSGIDANAQFCRIIVHPENPQQIFAASQYGLFRSDNGGTSWSNITDGELPNNTIMDMDFYYDVSAGSFVLYVIDQIRYFPDIDNKTTTNTGGIYKSSDNGETWTNINGDLYIDVNRLTGGVQSNYYKYIAKWFGISKTEAESLYDVMPTNVLQVFNSLNVDPSRPDSLYVGFADAQVQNSIMPGRLWGTSDGGQKWTNLARYYGPAWDKDKDYWIDRGNPYNANMNEGHEIFIQQFNSDYALRSMRYCTVNSRGDIMMISGHNTFLSTDHGATWNQVDEDYTADGNIMGRGNSNLPALTLWQDSRLGPGIVYLGSGEHRLWRTTLDGDGRQAVEQLPAPDTVSSLTTHPDDVNTVFTISYRQSKKEKIMRSTDGGATFEVWGTATPAEWQMRTHSLMIDPVDTNNFYFGVGYKEEVDLNKEGGFYCSTDGGKTFAPRNVGLPTNVRVRDIEFDPRDATKASLFVAAEAYEFQVPEKIEGGLFHSTDRGLTWTEVEIDSLVEGVNYIDFDSTGRIYITSGHRGADNGGIWYSDDYGSNWTRVFDSARAECIDVSPFDDNVIVASIGNLEKNPGVYLSLDRGLTWSKNNRAIGVPNKVLEVEFDLHDKNLLWLGSYGSGFYKGRIADNVDTHAVTFISGEGSTEHVIVVKDGESATAPTPAVMSGKTFTGWNGSYSSITAAATVTAQYRLDEYTVTFDAGEFGTITSGNAEQTVDYEEDAIAPTVTVNSSYVTHTGWNTTFDSVTSDLTVVATYSSSVPVNEQAPSGSDLYLWLDAGKGVTQSGGAVSKWMNLANPSFLTSGGSESPQLVVGTDSKPVIRFNGASYFTFDNVDHVDEQITVFTVHSRDSAQAGDSKWQRILSSYDAEAAMDNGGKGIVVSTKQELGAIPRTITATVPGLKTLKNLSIGVNATSESNQFLYGDLSEILVYRSDSVDTAAVTEYLKEKWFSYKITFNAGANGTIDVADQTQYVDYKKMPAAPAVTAQDGWEHTGWNITFVPATVDAVYTAVYEQTLVAETLELKEGYNLVSLSVLPVADQNVNTVVASISSKLDFVENGAGDRCTYDGSSWSNGIGVWNPLEGYLVKVSGDIQLNVSGTAVTKPAYLDLVLGMNLVPVAAGVNPLVYFDSIMDYVEYIRDKDGNIIREINDEWKSTITSYETDSVYVVKLKQPIRFNLP